MILSGVAAEPEMNGEKFMPLNLDFKPAEEMIGAYVHSKIRAFAQDKGPGT